MEDHEQMIMFEIQEESMYLPLLLEDHHQDQ